MAWPLREGVVDGPGVSHTRECEMKLLGLSYCYCDYKNRMKGKPWEHWELQRMMDMIERGFLAEDIVRVVPRFLDEIKAWALAQEQERPESEDGE